MKSYLFQAYGQEINDFNKMIGLLSQQLHVMIEYPSESVQQEMESAILELRVKVIVKNTDQTLVINFFSFKEKQKWCYIFLFFNSVYILDRQGGMINVYKMFKRFQCFGSYVTQFIEKQLDKKQLVEVLHFMIIPVILKKQKQKQLRTTSKF